MTSATPGSETFAERLLGYAKLDLRADATAGLTVAVMGVPQAMAYALIAGVPPVWGLYSAIVTCVVAAIIGSSKHLVTGPTNALCMVVASLIQDLPGRYNVDPLEIVLLLTFMTGAIQLAFGFLRLGGVIRYVSHSVVIGFTAGAGILIALNQLKNLLGVDISGEGARRSYEVAIATIRHASDFNPFALGIGLATAAIVILTPKVSPRLPAALLGVAITGGLSYAFGWHTLSENFDVKIVQDIGAITGGIPEIRIPQLVAMPSYELTRELGTGAAALAVLGLVEAASIARAVATTSGQRLDFTREFIGQGASNVVGSFFTCFAGSGSFTRTAVCYQSKGRTRGAAIFSAAWTLLALLLLGPIANYIPEASLAGILVVVAYSMIDKQRLKTTWKSGPSPRLVLAGTFVATLLLPLEYAVFVGVLLSVVILLRTIGKTDLTQLIRRSDVGFEEVPFSQAAPSPVVTVNMEGDLYFAAAEDLDHELLRCITPKTRVVVLRMKRLRAVGSTAMAMLEHFWRLLGQRRIYLVVCGIEDELRDVMTGSGLRTEIGEQNIFYADNTILQSTELALARAWSIVEMEERLGPAAEESDLAQSGRVSANDIMSTQCIRFGNQHQLREVVWLMSELLKQKQSAEPEPLFLQHRDGTLAGELSPWHILQALNAGIDPTRASTIEDSELGDLLRRDFERPIKALARTEIEELRENASLARLLEASVWHDLQVLPIVDAEGRVTGLITPEDLLRGLDAELTSRETAAGAEVSRVETSHAETSETEDPDA